MGATGGSRAFLISALAVTGISLLLRSNVPLQPVSYSVLPYDDGLFERAAVNLSIGRWLGPFDHLTLAKGVAYPAFVSMSSWTNIPLQAATQLTYLLACASVAVCLLVSTKRQGAAACVYALLALDPANFTSKAAHVNRDNWYPAITLLCLSLIFLTCYSVFVTQRGKRAAGLAVLAGLCCSTFWLCREEGIWILPAMVVIVVGFLLVGVRSAKRNASRPSRRTMLPRAALVALAAFGVSFWTLQAVVEAKNEANYGVGLTNDFSTGAFPRAYGEWSRVRGVALDDFVPFNKAQRAAVYAVSPNARKLRGVLEDPSNPWLVPGCTWVSICDDFVGGWAPWALRDAARLTGNFDTEEKFQEFFSRLGTDIAQACEQELLECAPALPASMQPLLRATIDDVIGSAGRWLTESLSSRDFYPQSDVSHFMAEIGAAERRFLSLGIEGVPETDEIAMDHIEGFSGVNPAYVWLASLYRVLLIGLIGAAIVALALRLVGRLPREGSLGAGWRILAFGLVTASASRLLLMAVVDTTQFPIDVRYHNVTRTLLIALIAMVAVPFVPRVLREVRLMVKPDARPAEFSSRAPSATIKRTGRLPAQRTEPG